MEKYCAQLILRDYSAALIHCSIPSLAKDTDENNIQKVCRFIKMELIYLDKSGKAHV